MQPKILYYKKTRNTEQDFDLVEIMENGEVVKRTFKQKKDGYHLYEETSRDGFNPNGEIRIDKVSFKKDGTLRHDEIANNSKTVETYKIKEWQKAREHVRELQAEVKEDTSVDYHSLLVLTEDAPNKDIPSPTGKHVYPIVKLRANAYSENIRRKVLPEKVEKAFCPVINETLYFNHYPAKNYVNTTGDNIFALDTRTTDDTYTDDDFLDYINFMIKKVEAKPEHYLTLIHMQREQRAMLEAEEIGDLYPR